jgi:hypothetical protein
MPQHIALPHQPIPVPGLDPQSLHLEPRVHERPVPLRQYLPRAREPLDAREVARAGVEEQVGDVGLLLPDGVAEAVHGAEGGQVQVRALDLQALGQLRCVGLLGQEVQASRLGG